MPRASKQQKAASKSTSPEAGDLGLVLYWASHGVEILETTSSVVRESSTRPAYGTSAGLDLEDRNSLIRALKEGLPVSAFARLQSEIGVSAKTLASVANIATRTLTRRKREGRLTADESERLLRIAVLYDRAIEVLGDRQRAREWFKTANRALGAKSPLEYADTGPGVREVEDLLGRIEHGVFS